MRRRLLTPQEMKDIVDDFILEFSKKHLFEFDSSTLFSKETYVRNIAWYSNFGYQLGYEVFENFRQRSVDTKPMLLLHYNKSRGSFELYEDCNLIVVEIFDHFYYYFKKHNNVADDVLLSYTDSCVNGIDDSFNDFEKTLPF